MGTGGVTRGGHNMRALSDEPCRQMMGMHHQQM
jgi:hypothetical protein